MNIDRTDYMKSVASEKKVIKPLNFVGWSHGFLLARVIEYLMKWVIESNESSYQIHVQWREKTATEYSQISQIIQFWKISSIYVK